MILEPLTNSPLERQALEYLRRAKEQLDIIRWQEGNFKNDMNAEALQISIIMSQEKGLSWRETMRTYLKIKIKSLATESRIIRHEQRKVLDKTSELYTGLHGHRVTNVRKESRHALLAYGFLRGRSYRCMEAKCRTKPTWSIVERMILKYGGEADIRKVKQKLSEWIT